jgi:hypothetical protein
MRVSTEFPRRLSIIPESQADTDWLIQLGLKPESAPLVRLHCSDLHNIAIDGKEKWFLVEIRKGEIKK